MPLKTSEILPYRDIKLEREKRLKRQKGVCPLCGTEILPEEAALDHSYDTGHVRATLHRSCNGAEGQIKRWAGQRSRGNDPTLFLKNLLKYWEKDYSKNLIHPTFGKRERKKRAKTGRTRKYRGKRK
jgi:hypothetical protein